MSRTDMPLPPATLHFIVLTAISAGLMVGYAASRPGLDADPNLQGAACFKTGHPWAQYYPYLPQGMNEGICFGNSMLKAMLSHPGPALVLKQLIPMFFIVIAMMTTEAHRLPTGFFTKRAGIFILLGQVVGIAVAAPLYFIFASISWSKVDKGGSGLKGDKAATYWTVFLSTLVGFYGLTLNNELTDYGYSPAALWQAFPLLVSLLNNALPPFLRKLLPRHARAASRIPIVLIALVSTYLSISAHWKMLLSNVSWSQILDWRMTTFGPAQFLHRIFVLDAILLAIVLISYPPLVPFKGVTRAQRIRMIAVMAGVGLVTGHAAPAALAWASAELIRGDKEEKEVRKAQ